jgi:hypothetical protein
MLVYTNIHTYTWHYATSWKVSGSKIYEVIFKFTSSFRPRYALGFTQPLPEISTRSIKIMFVGSKVRPVLKADNITTICEPIV